MILLYLAATAAVPNPLEGLVQNIFTGVVVAALVSGIFAIVLKRTRGPADKLAEAEAVKNARKEEAEKAAALQAARDEGYQASVTMIREAAEAAATSYREQIEVYQRTTADLRATLSDVLTAMDTARITASETERNLRERISDQEAKSAELRRLLAEKEAEIELYNIADQKGTPA